jgi:hypothetical protein
MGRPAEASLGVADTLCVKPGFDKNDSRRLGFVTACLFAGAVNVGDVRNWAVDVLAREEGSAPCLIDLCEFDDSPFKIYKVIGFVPLWSYSEDQRLALFGIAARRGREPFDWPLTVDEAVEKLAQHPEIEAAFRTEFPFLEW